MTKNKEEKPEPPKEPEDFNEIMKQLLKGKKMTHKDIVEQRRRKKKE